MLYILFLIKLSKKNISGNLQLKKKFLNFTRWYFLKNQINLMSIGLRTVSGGSRMCKRRGRKPHFGWKRGVSYTLFKKNAWKCNIFTNKGGGGVGYALCWIRHWLSSVPPPCMLQECFENTGRVLTVDQFSHHSCNVPIGRLIKSKDPIYTLRFGFGSLYQ